MDETSDCQRPDIRKLCNNNVYHDLMMKKCAKTCGMCATAQTPTEPEAGGEPSEPEEKEEPPKEEAKPTCVDNVKK